ncbi:ATP-binding cassette domain-containing protein [Streptomyces actuosus]|uniref:ATP-binding cassette domain-containing protein n=1 Tax=Streptomyces actuosus TaxID=1885 RepID=A0ABS2VTW9_STRAS|nr:ATP-binding cassette domain-containing protein [Streptomyces actuosus]MBN0046490.1 ATP-binding cassette domain-containing protein [Streptomyces actuosus]
MIQAFGLTSIPRKDLPPAVDDVSFEAGAGRITTLLGAPGAGKTTALGLMLELRQGRGVTHFRGRPLHRIAHPSREVGVLLGDVPGHPARTVRGHLRMLCAAAGVPVRRADEVLESVGLVGLHDERLGTLSRGMDRRLGLACALLADPHTLVLDAPSEGLSVRESRWLHDMLRAHATQGGTVLLTTDDPKEAARTADRVVTLERGRLVADQDAAHFARTRLRPRIAVRTPHAARLAAVLTKEARTARRSVEVVQDSGNRLSVYGTTCADVGEAAFRHGILVHQLADEVGDMGPGAGMAPPPAATGDGAAQDAPTGRAEPAARHAAHTAPQPDRAALAAPAPGIAHLPGTPPRTAPEPPAGPGPHPTAPSPGTGADIDPRAGAGADAPSGADAHRDADARPGAGAGAGADVGAGGRPGPVTDAAPPRAGSPSADRPAAAAAPTTPPAAAATPAPAAAVTVHPGGTAQDPDGRRAAVPASPLPPLPPPISVRPAPSPLRPLRYELRRATGVGTGFVTAAVVLVVSASTAALLAGVGHTPQARLLAAWPQQVPLPPAALGAGLLGALAFGDEFRHPALAADRGTVPRRLGLLTAKLLVSAAAALLLAFLTVGCDAEVLHLLYGRELARVPADWFPLAASWVGLVVGCAWAGVLAAGVFRSTTAGLAAVVAVPVAVVPLVHKVVEGADVRAAAGLPVRVREVFLLRWPFGGERRLAAAAHMIAQPVGSALMLSLTALLCAYVLTTLRSRVR